MKLSLISLTKASITQAVARLQPMCLSLLLLLVLNGPGLALGNSAARELEQFKSAWQAAGKGDHESFRQAMEDLEGYILFPYLQYEDFRNRRSRVPTDEMEKFLDAHQDWAFAPGLRGAWLKSLAHRGRWSDLVAHSQGVTDTVLRCQRVRGKIILKQTDGVLAQAQELWTSGKSQPEECDDVFSWLVRNDGIPHKLAWERIQLAIAGGSWSLVSYLARFVPASQRSWLDDWVELNRSGFSRIEKTRNWPDNEITRMIVATTLQRLARKDTDLAAGKLKVLDGHFNWMESTRVRLLREIALYSAVDLDDETATRMEQVPVAGRDSQLLEWWARFLLSRQDWVGLITVVEKMPEETRMDDRWQYWLAQARLRSGQAEAATKLLGGLAEKANYYGFLAADELGLGYNICPRQPDIEASEIDRIADIDGFKRALELKQAGLENWAIGEWSLTASRMPAGELRNIAALANREGWYDRVIFALGNSGDRQFYDWRFPLAWEKDIKHHAAMNQLDPAWVYGTIRSESAMQVTAHSSANALGLMQLTTATARRVAKKHGLTWHGSSQLKTVNGNLPIGTAYMGDLLKDHGQNPVLASGSYNAGPNAVDRWLDTRPKNEAAIWVETLPYFETRDYIPRVLAFTSLYEWRLGGSKPDDSIKRVSGRMPHIESGKIRVDGSAQVTCRDQT